jgi:uncharacterized membrane protein YoaK (UPF0700 family)
MTSPTLPLTRPTEPKEHVLGDPRQGPLPVLLLALTAVTGIVDAVTLLRLDGVFVANMTGNVVFTGFAIAGAPGISLTASLFALAGFLAGAALAGGLSPRLGGDRGTLLLAAAIAELALVTVALAFAVGAGHSPVAPIRNSIVVLLALAMGIQNVAARRLAVPDLTTTVLTMTLTGIATDLRARRRRPALIRRLLAVAAMLGGATLGACLVLTASPAAAIALAVGLLAAVTAAAAALRLRPGQWREYARWRLPPSPAAERADGSLVVGTFGDRVGT